MFGYFHPESNMEVLRTQFFEDGMQQQLDRCQNTAKQVVLMYLAEKKLSTCRNNSCFSYNNQKMTVRLSKFILLFALLLTVSAVNWQAADNITQSNRTFIWDTINNNIASYAPSNLAPFSTFISTALNQQWDPAWNVFVFRLIDPTIDAVVYGYAFRKHWMWFNGYAFGGETYSFVIWKDFNCHTWHTIANSDRQASRLATDANLILSNAFYSATDLLQSQDRLSYTDIWSSIYNIATTMDPNSIYTIVAIQNGIGATDATNDMNGHFCSSGGAESFRFGRLGLADSSDRRFKFVCIKMQ